MNPYDRIYLLEKAVKKLKFQLCCIEDSEGDCPAISALPDNIITCEEDGLYATVDTSGFLIGAVNGLSVFMNNVVLGGPLIDTTTIILDGNELIISDSDANLDRFVFYTDAVGATLGIATDDPDHGATITATNSDGLGFELGVTSVNNATPNLVYFTSTSGVEMRIGDISGTGTGIITFRIQDVERARFATDGSFLIDKTASSNVAFKLQVGDGTEDSRSLFTVSSNYALAVANGVNGVPFYIGATNSTTIPDLLFSNNSGTERARLTDSGNFIVTGTVTAGVAQIGNWPSAPTYAMFRHSAQVANDYGFMQGPSGDSNFNSKSLQPMAFRFSNAEFARLTEVGLYIGGPGVNASRLLHLNSTSGTGQARFSNGANYWDIGREQDVTGDFVIANAGGIWARVTPGGNTDFAGFVSATRAGDSYFNAINTTSAIQTGFGSGATVGFVGTLSGHDVEFRTNNVARLTIDAAGDSSFSGYVRSLAYFTAGSGGGNGYGFAGNGGGTQGMFQSGSTTLLVAAAAGNIGFGDAGNSVKYGYFLNTDNSLNLAGPLATNAGANKWHFGAVSSGGIGVTTELLEFTINGTTYLVGAVVSP